LDVLKLCGKKEQVVLIFNSFFLRENLQLKLNQLLSDIFESLVNPRRCERVLKRVGIRPSKNIVLQIFG